MQQGNPAAQSITSSYISYRAGRKSEIKDAMTSANPSWNQKHPVKSGYLAVFSLYCYFLFVTLLWWTAVSNYLIKLNIVYLNFLCKLVVLKGLWCLID